MTQSDAFLSTAKRVIAQEAEALGLLSDSLGTEFTKAVDTILMAKGRTIVTGMGKSGHIARKIAATLASTGTPAHFVHPTEASHGDLGMIGDGDVCLVLSNSGETPELADVIAYTRRFKIPMIGVASNPDSSLIRACDVALILPKAAEACGHGIVPTTSTTMTLALGDALAIALMEHRAFTADNFRVLHPGGKLGSRLTKVRDLMHSDMPLVVAETPMRGLARDFRQRLWRRGRDRRGRPTERHHHRRRPATPYRRAFGQDRRRHHDPRPDDDFLGCAGRKSRRTHG